MSLSPASSLAELFSTHMRMCFGSKPSLEHGLTAASTVDIRARIWICPFCLMRNPLPPHYKDITENTIPPELHPQSTTIEYQLARPAPAPPIFVYVVDTCQEDDSLQAVKDSLVMSLSLLPPNALVGLITYGTMVSGTKRSPLSQGKASMLIHII
jgi:hypothetical protein